MPGNRILGFSDPMSVDERRIRKYWIGASPLSMDSQSSYIFDTCWIPFGCHILSPCLLWLSVRNASSISFHYNHELDPNQYICATYPLVDHDGEIPLPRISAPLPPFGEIFALMNRAYYFPTFCGPFLSYEISNNIFETSCDSIIMHDQEYKTPVVQLMMLHEPLNSHFFVYFTEYMNY